MTDKVPFFENDLASLQFRLPERTDEGNKGSFGRCVIVGGCMNYVGAPRFAAESAAEVLALLGETAMRSGAGTTVLAVPDFLATALYPVVRYSAVFPLPSRDGHIVFERERAREIAKKATSFAVGMGMGDGDAESWVRFVLDGTECRVVLDADGLGCAGKIADYKGRAVLTPHAGEFAAMTGLSVSEIKTDAVRLAREYAAEHNCVIIVKSHESVISDGREVWINRTGNGKLSKLAARTGAYVLGRSAELSGTNAVAHLPDDIMSVMPLAFDELQGVMRL